MVLGDCSGNGQRLRARIRGLLAGDVNEDVVTAWSEERGERGYMFLVGCGFTAGPPSPLFSPLGFLCCPNQSDRCQPLSMNQQSPTQSHQSCSESPPPPHLGMSWRWLERKRLASGAGHGCEGLCWPGCGSHSARGHQGRRLQQPGDDRSCTAEAAVLMYRQSAKGPQRMHQAATDASACPNEEWQSTLTPTGGVGPCRRNVEADSSIACVLDWEKRPHL